MIRLTLNPLPPRAYSSPHSQPGFRPMLRRLIARLTARLTGKPHRPNLPPLPRPGRIHCVNALRAMPSEARSKFLSKREDQQRAIEIYALIGYDANGRPLPEGSRPLPDPEYRWVTRRLPLRRD